MKRRLFATALLVCAIVFTALGVWQVERRAWKRQLIAQVNERISAAAKPMEDWSTVGVAAPYTRVRLTGKFLHQREALVQAVTDLGAGWWVLTPLQTEAGVILVNRGFVPPERRAAATRKAGSPEGQVTITGLVRSTEPGGGFLRTNDAAEDRWYSRDVAAIARARGIDGVPPIFIDADATPNPGGYPVGGLTVVSFRNAHLVYALTWFAMATLSLAGMVIVLRRKEV